MVIFVSFLTGKRTSRMSRLMGSGIFLFMSWWSQFLNGFRISPTDTRQSIANRMPSGIQFFEYNGKTIYQSTDTSEHLKDVYECCAPLSNVISYAGKAFSEAKIEVLQANNDNYVRGQYKQWDKLFEYPNPVQNGEQFLKQLYIYTKINGYCFVLKNYGLSADTGYPPTSMYVLPYWLIEIDQPKRRFTELEPDDILNNVYLQGTNGQPKKKIPKENLLLIKDTTGVVDEEYFLPISRVSLNNYPISTVMSAAEAEITMIQNKGATGILSNEGTDSVGTAPMDTKQKEEVQQEFSGYGLSRAQRQIIITSAALKWQPMNFPTKDLLLQESYTKGVKDICDAFGVPFELLSHSDRKNLANVNSFDKILYQNTIIPDGRDIAKQLTIGLGLNNLNTPIYVNFDYSHIQALQKSEEEKGKGLDALTQAYQKQWDLGLVTRNMILEEMGKDTVKGKPEFDMYKWELVNDNEPEQQGDTEPNDNNENG